MSIKRILFSFAAILLVGSYSYAGEPRNLELDKRDVIRYHDSGEYEKDIARVTQQAKAYLQAQLDKSKNSNKKLAIVLDIDETALSNYPDMLRLNFGGTLKEIEEAEGKGTDSAIEPMLKLYQFAKANHVSVFFITARRENYRSVTEANLEKAGYQNWDGLYLMPMSYHEKSVTPFKASIRKQLIEKGYDIVLSISDQKTDLKGGYADKAFKLPNPYYLVP